MRASRALRPLDCRFYAAGHQAFTLVELLVVIAVLALLGALLLPAFAGARAKARAGVCLSNARQWGLAFLMYTADNHDTVPEEGNTTLPIRHGQNRDAWYETVSPSINLPKLTELYATGNPPLPDSASIFSCPTAPPPNFTPKAAGRAYFMYGMNGRLCVNRGGRTRVKPNTRLAQVLKPSDTIFIGEVDGLGKVHQVQVGQAQSNVTGQYAVGRHQQRGVFALTDGSARLIATAEVMRTQNEANRAAAEWRVERTVYWYPSPTTPDW